MGPSFLVRERPAKGDHSNHPLFRLLFAPCRVGRGSTSAFDGSFGGLAAECRGRCGSLTSVLERGEDGCPLRSTAVSPIEPYPFG